MVGFHPMPARRDCCYALPVKNPVSTCDPLLAELKRLIADRFHLDEMAMSRISPQAPLIGGSLGLDSLDGFELALCLEDRFGVTFGSAAETHAACASLASLAGHIRRHNREQPGRVPAAPAAGPLLPSQGFQPAPVAD